jgi:hypothetical protein
MGMSTRVIAFRPADEKWKEMKDIYDACYKAGIRLPEEVDDFFDGETIGMRYNVCGLPTVVVLSNGELIGRIDSGVTRQGVIDLIKQARED